jgi:hypothetical protein
MVCLPASSQQLLNRHGPEPDGSKLVSLIRRESYSRGDAKWIPHRVSLTSIPFECRRVLANHDCCRARLDPDTPDLSPTIYSSQLSTARLLNAAAALVRNRHFSFPDRLLGLLDAAGYSSDESLCRSFTFGGTISESSRYSCSTAVRFHYRGNSSSRLENHHVTNIQVQ